MARKAQTKAQEPTPESDSDNPSQQEDETLVPPPTEIDPYKVLSLPKDATSDQVKSAYRKAALKAHPDKNPDVDKETANKKFQEVALAYAILSDERRRKRYDTTGNTAETIAEDDDFDWLDFFREQTAAVLNGDAIDKFKNEYQGSEQEKEDVLQTYTRSRGDMDVMYEEIMCSNVLDDDERFRGIIDNAIQKGTVEAYSKYTKESNASKKRRIKEAQGEAAEAEELAEELGIKDRLYGNGAKKGGKKQENSEDSLKALIQQRGKERSESFLDHMEAKYGGGGRHGSGKRKIEEPPEELFQKNAKKTKTKSKGKAR